MGLERRQVGGDLHFVTFSCFHRLGYLKDPTARDLFEEALARMCRCYQCDVFGYVVMPEHVHLLLSEPEKALLGVALQALKISVSKRSKERPFWQARYYDFNVFTISKRIEKLDYMHCNPVTRELVRRPQDWPWSSYLFYEKGEAGLIPIDPV